MRTRSMIGIAVIFGLIGAFIMRDLAAAYIAVIGGALVYLFHTVEFKVNKLLDERRIAVWDDEIGRD